MRSIDNLMGCRKICTVSCNYQKTHGVEVSLRSSLRDKVEIWRCPARAMVDVQAGSSQNVLNSRLISVLSMQFVLQLLNTDEETLWLWTYCFLHLLLVPGDEESTVRSSDSDEAFEFSVHKHLVCDTKATPQHLDTTWGRFFLQVFG